MDGKTVTIHIHIVGLMNVTKKFSIKIYAKYIIFLATKRKYRYNKTYMF